MSFFSYAVGALILILVLLRQVRVRPVPRVFQPRLPVVIGVIGLFEMFSYAGNHHVSSSAWLWVAGHPGRRRARCSASCAASPCGSGRATAGCCARAAPSPWRSGSCRCWCTSQATPDRATRGGRARGGELPPLPGRDAVRAVLRRVPPGPAAVGAARARRRAAAAGAVHPGARVPSSPASGPGGGPAGRARVKDRPHRARAAGSFADDPNIIDAEVVEDDDDHGPPELHAPR